MIEKERIQQANLTTNERIQQTKQRSGDWKLETGDRRGVDNQIKGKRNKEKKWGFWEKESGRRWLLLGLRFENKRMWDLLLLGLIWGKGKGKGGIFVRLTGWRGEDWEQWEDSIVFDNFVKLGKLGPSLPSLTDFNRVWLSLTEFPDFRVFYPISHDIPELTHKIVWFYTILRVNSRVWQPWKTR